MRARTGEELQDEEAPADLRPPPCQPRLSTQRLGRGPAAAHCAPPGLRTWLKIWSQNRPPLSKQRSLTYSTLYLQNTLQEGRAFLRVRRSIRAQRGPLLAPDAHGSGAAELGVTTRR